MVVMMVREKLSHDRRHLPVPMMVVVMMVAAAVIVLRDLRVLRGVAAGIQRLQQFGRICDRGQQVGVGARPEHIARIRRPRRRSGSVNRGKSGYGADNAGNLPVHWRIPFSKARESRQGSTRRSG